MDAMEWWEREERRLRKEARENEAAARAHAKKQRGNKLFNSNRSPSTSSSNAGEILADDISSLKINNNSGKAARKGSWTFRQSNGSGNNSQTSREGAPTSSRDTLEDLADLDTRPVMELASKSEWVDSDHVVICMG